MEPKKIKILVADNDRDIVRECTSNLEPYGFDVIEGQEDASQLAGQIRVELPDVVLLSIVLKGSDALKVMGKLRDNPPAKRPLFLLLPPCSDSFLGVAASEGACGCFEFPLDYGLMAYRINKLYEKVFGSLTLQPASPRVTQGMYVTDVLLSMGVPVQNKGFGCLRAGIEMVLDEPKLMNEVTKSLYPAIGKQFGSTSAQVEKAIRHAIDFIWSSGNAKMLEKYFNHTAAAPRRRPVNSEFIAVMAIKIQMELQKQKLR